MQAPIPRKMADRFYLSAHDHKGRPRLTARAIEYGTACGVLGELVVDDYLVVVDDRLQVRPRGWTVLELPRVHRRPTVVRWLLEKVSGSPTVVVGEWITEIGLDAPQWITGRLEADDVVHKAQPWWLAFSKTPTRYETRDINEPHKLGDHLAQALQGRSGLSVVDVFLAGLLQATQLHRTLIAAVPHLDHRITALIRALAQPAHAQPAVRDESLIALLTQTRRLLDTAALAQTL